MVVEGFVTVVSTTTMTRRIFLKWTSWKSLDCIRWFVLLLVLTVKLMGPIRYVVCNLNVGNSDLPHV